MDGGRKMKQKKEKVKTNRYFKVDNKYEATKK